MNKKNKKQAIETLRFFNWIILIFAILLVYPFSLMWPVLFDAPGSEKNPLSWFIVFLVPSYPILLFISQFLSKKYYKKGEYNMALRISLIAALPGLFVLITSILGSMI